jgi:membrane protein CcdC involved in cytochrome C biogenesis
MQPVLHLFAVVLAAVCLWSMRHEITEKPATSFGWALPPFLAVVIAAILLFVSPGKRFELWTVAILIGMAMGLGAGVILKVDKDFERNLVRVLRTWDGVGAASVLLLLAVARFVTSDLMIRQSGKFGVLGAAAAFLAAFLAGRVVTLSYYTAPKAIHLDMTLGQRPRTH